MFKSATVLIKFSDILFPLALVNNRAAVFSVVMIFFTSCYSKCLAFAGIAHVVLSVHFS